MKQTGVLHVINDFMQRDDRIIVHPNDGFDLGIVTSFRAVDIYLGPKTKEEAHKAGGHLKGVILLESRCKQGTVEIGKRTWEQLGKPSSLVLLLEEDKLLVGSVRRQA